MSRYALEYAKRRSTIDWKDPWGWVVAGTAGGGMLLATGSVVVGTASAAATMGVKAGVDYWQGPRRLNPEARALLRRAKRARRAVAKAERRTKHRGAGAGPTSLTVTAGLVVDDVAIAAGRITQLQESREKIDPEALRLREEELQFGSIAAGVALDATGQKSSAAVQAQREKALAAVRSHLGVVARLDDAQNLLLARTEAAVLGLESLEARLAELDVLQGTMGEVGDASDQVQDLTDGLEVLRSTLTELSSLGEGSLPMPPDAPGAAGVPDGSSGPTAPSGS